MATHLSILAWKIPWTEEPSGLHRVKELNTTEVSIASSNEIFHLNTVLIVTKSHLLQLKYRIRIKRRHTLTHSLNPSGILNTHRNLVRGTG